ncbi:MAG: C39 family peptidase [Armatimonadetes bacterium]|nr:C39 family peptidase [Armatimonadota bacterium]
MKKAKITHCFIVSLLLLFTATVIAPSFGENVPTRSKLADLPYIQQLKNYCGPAVVASVLGYWGLATDQKTIGKAIFDKGLQATNGADMIIYAREKGFSAYSWNSSIADLKEKLALGMPVIVLQDSSRTDRSGHYRIATGYDDASSVVFVKDPYDPYAKEIPYDEFERLWRRHGNWSLLICPAERDTFKESLDEKNPVVHIDLAYIYYKRGNIEASERESRLALALEPGNYSARDLFAKATHALGARSQGEKSGDN